MILYIKKTPEDLAEAHNPSNNGLFITLEGADGSGKTTQWQMLKDKYAKDERWLFTRNPGGTALGIKLRELLLNDKQIKLYAESELLLYMADRAQHIKESIKPALETGKIVVCDRFTDSTIAYQGYGRGIPLYIIETLNTIACQSLTPNITILLDVEPAIGLSRAKEKNKMEHEGLDFQHRIREGFLELAQKETKRFRVLDSTKHNPIQLHDSIDKIIKSMFGKS